MQVFECYIDGHLKFVRASYRDIREAAIAYHQVRGGTFIYRLATIH
jgi:hypothetical protein